MERLKWEKQRDERLRQQIRENSTELRELEAKLRAGYMNKERAAQLAEKETLRCLEEEREAEIAAMMKSELDKAVEMEEKREAHQWERSIQYQEQLERQLEEQVGIHALLRTGGDGCMKTVLVDYTYVSCPYGGACPFWSPVGTAEGSKIR